MFCSNELTFWNKNFSFTQKNTHTQRREVNTYYTPARARIVENERIPREEEEEEEEL